MVKCDSYNKKIKIEATSTEKIKFKKYNDETS
jgi:hypothetical protein